MGNTLQSALRSFSGLASTSHTSSSTVSKKLLMPLLHPNKPAEKYRSPNRREKKVARVLEEGSDVWEVVNDEHGEDDKDMTERQMSLNPEINQTASTEMESEVEDRNDGYNGLKPSAIANSGKKYIGGLEVPKPLQEAVEELIRSGKNTKLIRSTANELIARLHPKPTLPPVKVWRKPSKSMPGDTHFEDAALDKIADQVRKGVQKRTRKSSSDWVADLTETSDPQAAYYSLDEAKAYAARIMSGNYGTIVNVFRELRGRFDAAGKKPPSRIIDFGSGIGTGLWAALNVWTDREADWENAATKDVMALRSYTGIDPNDVMRSVAKKMLSEYDLKPVKVHFSRALNDSRDVCVNEEACDDTLALCTYTLTELGTERQRRELIQQMWSTKASTIMLIEPGNRAGYLCLMDARDWLLKQGTKSPRINDSSAETIEVGGAEFVLDTSTSEQESATGSYVLAPCPHDGVCPLLQTTDFCHYSQRISRPAFLRAIHGNGKGEQDAAYSYLIVRRKNRDQDMNYPLNEPTAESNPNQWGRIVYPPMKKKGHVIADMCLENGTIMRQTFTKSQGKQTYLDARKSHWGDLFPHAPRKIGVLKSKGVKYVGLAHEEREKIESKLKAKSLRSQYKRSLKIRRKTDLPPSYDFLNTSPSQESKENSQISALVRSSGT